MQQHKSHENIDTTHWLNVLEHVHVKRLFIQSEIPQFQTPMKLLEVKCLQFLHQLGLIEVESHSHHKRVHLEAYCECFHTHS